MDRIELFNNLMVLAAADGKFAEEEVNFLVVRAEDWGIPHREVEAAIAMAASADAEMTISGGRRERVELLQQMIHLMAVDGHLAEIERRMCAAASAAMGFSTEEFSGIVDSLLK